MSSQNATEWHMVLLGISTMPMGIMSPVYQYCSNKMTQIKVLV